MIASHRRAPRALLSRIGETFAGFKKFDQEFSFVLRWAETFDGLFDNRGDLFRTGTDELIPRAFATGRVLLSSAGAGGKTVILQRAAGKAVKEGIAAFHVDLKRWTSTHYGRWAELGTSYVRQADFLLQTFSLFPISSREVDELPAGTRKLILMDGLNEVLPGTAEGIITCLDSLVGNLVGAAVVVADRMVRRSLPNSKRWQLVTVLPLERGQVERLLVSTLGPEGRRYVGDADRLALLESPYFLNEALQGVPVAGSRAESFRQWFIEHAGLTAPELERAAQGAFEIYERVRARTFSLPLFTEAVGDPEVVRKLEASGALLDVAGFAQFDHHIKHDYLAAAYLANHEARWGPASFNAVTFDASSFDPLALVLEQVDDPAAAERLLRSAYDWNLYGVAYALTEAGATAATGVSHEMCFVILAMLAERRFDLFMRTAQKAADALAVFPSGDARRLLAAPSRQAVLELAGGFQSKEDWFLQWKQLFGRGPQVAAAPADVGLLGNRDSILGWTLANVLKRSLLGEELQQALRDRFAAALEPPIRWRVVHVLGAWPTEANVAFLLHALDTDQVGEVRYGATRSLMEAACRGDIALRSAIFTSLGTRAAALLADKFTRGEIEATMFLRGPDVPADWRDGLAKLMRELYLATNDLDTRRRLADLAAALEARYSAED